MSAPQIVSLGLGALVWLTGCTSPGAPPREDMPLAQTPKYLAVSQGGINVVREGRVVATEAPCPLVQGDVIETDSSGAAVLHFPEGELYLRSNTRVRVGSLEVLFGEIFATLRNLFTVSSENVVAGVEGTSFSFETSPGGPTRISVEEGRVVCTSVRGAWSPIPLEAGRSLVLPKKGAKPQVSSADRTRLRELLRWAEQLKR